MTDGKSIDRVVSGIAGLDMILQGGFTKGGIHIVQGAPGAGKTTFANQLCFNHAKDGGRSLYVTLLSETHSRMLLHLGTMQFFDPSRLMEQISYVSGLGTLQEEGLSGLVTLLRREIAQRKANILVLDGLVAAEDQAASDNEFKRFIQELQTQTGLYGCTVFLLTTARGNAVPAEHTMVDGIVELADMRHGSRSQRSLYVRKLRGSDYLEGQHHFQITANGLEVFPRLEATTRIRPSPDRVSRERVGFGIERFDTMLGGGLPEGTVTGLLGPSGIGKTTLGSHFLCGATPERPGLYFGFYETPSRLIEQNACLGMNLETAIARDDICLMWQPMGEYLQDALAHRLLAEIDRRGVQRLFLDGLEGFSQASVEPGRLQRFFAALSNELRIRGVTTVYTMETPDVVGPGIHVPINGISGLVENLIALRFVERHCSIHRLLSVVKLRNSGFDPGLREFRIEHGQGVMLGGAFGHAEKLLSGFATDPAGEPSALGGQ